MECKQILRLVLSTIFVIAISTTALADWKEGLAAFDAGEFEEASKNFAEITQSNPDWAGGYYMLGRCQLAQGEAAKAIANLRKAVDLNPSDMDAVVALSQALLVQREYAETRRLLEKINIDVMSPPLKSQTSIIFASALLGVGEASEAINFLQEYLISDQKNAAVFRTLAKAQSSTGDRKAAFQSYLKAFHLEPTASTGLAATTTALAIKDAATSADQRKQWSQKALAIGSKLATSFPDPEHDLLAGEAALGAEDLDAAVVWFRAAVSKDESDPLAWYFLGRTLVSLGQVTEAYETFSKALQLSPDQPLAKRIHGRMGQIAACKLDLKAAAAHYRAAEKDDQAAQIDQLVIQFAEALNQLEHLRSRVREIRQMEGELKELGDIQGVTAMREQALAEEKKISEIEENLEAVRSALCQ